MHNITIYCLKKKSEIDVCFLLNTYSFSTLKFNPLRDPHHYLSKLRIKAEIFENSNSFLHLFDPWFDDWFSLYLPTLSLSSSSKLSYWVLVTSVITSVFISLPFDVLTFMSKSMYSSS